jgi:N-acyl homoserine lactone hydrolase
MTTTIQTVLRGRSLTTAEGSVGFGAVNLVTTWDAPGAPHRILFDTAHTGRRRALLRALEDMGLTVDDIDVVVLSHAHWDHVQNADLFPRARVLMHTDEPAYTESPAPGDHVTPLWTGLMLRHIGVQTVGDREPIAPGVHTLHLPGHTAGSMGLTVETPDGVHVLSGDAVSSATALDWGRCTVAHHDERLATASVELVGTLADFVWPGHDRPFAVRDNRPGDYLEAEVPLAFRSGGRVLHLRQNEET